CTLAGKTAVADHPGQTGARRGRGGGPGGWGPRPTRPRTMTRALPVSIRRANAADGAAALGVTGLLTKPSLRRSKMLAPTERSRGPSSAVLILDPCWSLCSFID